MKKLLSLIILTLSINAYSQTANNFSSYVPYNGNYTYGVNQGYYTGNWSSQNTAKIASDIGSKNVRIPFYDDFLTNYGMNAELQDVKYYTDSLGMSEITAFVGSPHSSHKDSATFFKGLYLPTWLDSAKTQINPANTYAAYLFKVVQVYGKYIKFWEIINEPDFTYSSGGWAGDITPPLAGSWFDHNPLPSELTNLNTTVFVYNRLLRVSWEVIKTVLPNTYVCTGGIGNRSFLDAILRNTDNPVDGSISAAYPNKAGAYFDVISFHNYPQYQLKYWDNKLGVVHTRHSDAGVNIGFLKVKNWMDSIAANYGYNGSTFPKKQYICTETGVSRIGSGDDWGSDSASRNYIIKAIVACQRNGIGQMYVYQLGDYSNADQFSKMGLYYWFGDSTIKNKRTLTPQGVAFNTASKLLLGKKYDTAASVALNLPSNVDGAAFKGKDGLYTYVLWAKTTTDLSEQALGKYIFSTSNTLNRFEWDYSQTGVATKEVTTVKLSASPSFFQEDIVARLALPIVLVNFSGTNTGSNITLSWLTADESGLDHFELQHSPDGSVFSSLSSIQPSGAGYPYQSIDPKPYDGNNFYRLKMINKNGAVTYSKVVVIMYGTTEVLNIEAFNMSGQLIKQDITSDLNSFKNSLPRGLYIIRKTNVSAISVEKYLKN